MGWRCGSASASRAVVLRAAERIARLCGGRHPRLPIGSARILKELVRSMLGRTKLVLASGSPRRLSLLNQAGIEPDALRPADVDETPMRGELPRACANRLARAKAEAGLKSLQIDDDLRGAYLLAADTVVAVGRRILPKAELVDEASQCLRLLSGRNHRVYTAVCLVTPKGSFRQRLVETRVRFKRLAEDDIQAYIGSGEWRGKGRRLCRAGHRRIVCRQDGRLLQQHRRSAVVRDRDIARRRGLSDSPWLDQCQLKPRPRHAHARFAANRRPKPRNRFVRSAAADVDLNRWLSGSYAIPGRPAEEDDAE